MKNSTIVMMLLCLFSFSACNSGGSETATKEPVNAPKKVEEAEKINWLSIEEAEKAMATDPKGGMYVMVYANWCPKCEKFDETTYQNPKVIKDINKFFYPVKMDAQYAEPITYRGKEYTNPNYDHSKTIDQQNSYHELLYEIEAKSIPCVVFIDENFEIQGTEMGYKEAEDLRSYLHMYK